MNISNQNQNPAAPAPVLPGVMHDDMSDEWAREYSAAFDMYDKLVQRLSDPQFAALYRVISKNFDQRKFKSGKK